MQREREEGLLEGMEKGMQKGILSTAKKMKEIGVSSDIISNATGLSIEDIEKL